MRRSGRLSGAGVVCWSRHGRSWRVPDAGLSSSSLCAIFSIFVVVSGMTFFVLQYFLRCSIVRRVAWTSETLLYFRHRLV